MRNIVVCVIALLAVSLPACTSRRSGSTPSIALPGATQYSLPIPEQHEVAVAVIRMDRPADRDRMFELLEAGGIAVSAHGSLSWTIITHEEQSWKALACILADPTLAMYAVMPEDLERQFAQLATLRRSFGLPE